MIGKWKHATNKWHAGEKMSSIQSNMNKTKIVAEEEREAISKPVRN